MASPARSLASTHEGLLAVLRPFERASPLPRSTYLEPAALDIEESALFATSWIPVAHQADVPRPGDWVRAPLRGRNLIVLRGADLELTALHGICAHRGTLLCEGERGHLPELRIRCPYHAWTYATDGRLLEAPGAVSRPGEGPRSLSDVRLEVYAGVVFVNLDQAAPPLAQSWRGGPPWLSRASLWPLERARRTDHVVRANWKLLAGNFQESHHFPSVHPGLEGRTPWAGSSSVVHSDAWLGGRMKLAPRLETVSESGQRRGRPYVAAEEDRGCVLDALVLPLWLTSLQPDYLLTYRLAPLAVDRTLVVAEIHVHPAALARGVDLEDVFTFWDRTNAEDRAICELQQRGLEASPSDTSRYAASEDGLHAFERIVASRILRDLGVEVPA